MVSLKTQMVYVPVPLMIVSLVSVQSYDWLATNEVIIHPSIHIYFEIRVLSAFHSMGLAAPGNAEQHGPTCVPVKRVNA